MAIVNRVLAAFLVVVGFLVWANLIATPVYHDGSPDYPVWQILNYFMAVAAVIILVKGFLMRRAHAHEDGACLTRSSICGSALPFMGQSS